MSIIQHSKEEIMNELIHLRKRNEELELKLQEENSKYNKLINSYSVDQLETILEILPTAIVIVDSEDGKVLYTNKRADELYGTYNIGIEINEIVYKIQAFNTTGKCYPVEEWPVTKSLKLGEIIQNEEMIIKNNKGLLFPVIVSSAPLYDENGKINKAICVFEDMSNIKHNEEALKESENLYKTLFENTEDGFEIIELLYNDLEKVYDYRWIKVNKAWEKQVGLKSAYLECKRASDIYSVVENYWLERYDRVIKSGKSERYEVYGEETRRWFDCLCFPYTERKVGILFKDITKKKHAENALIESEHLYRTLFENTEDIFQINELIYDEFGKVSDYKLIKVNDAFEIHTGLKAIDVIGKQAKNIFTCDLNNRIEKFDEVKNSNKVERYEFYCDNTKRWYDILCFPYTKGLVGELSRDITEHKEYERKIALHAEILSNVQDAVVVTDENIVITYCNRAYINLFGWNEHEIIGKSIYNFLNTYTDAGSKAEIRKLLKDNDNLPDAFQFKELSCFCKDGKKVIIDLNISRLKGTNDDFKGFIASIRDVSQRVEDLNKLQHSEKNAKKLIEKLRRADENKNEFLNMLSHEIRNPLAAAMLSLSLLNSVNENNVQATKAKGTLKRQLKHLSCLVDDLLDLTRIKTNKINLNKEILEINELVQNVVIDHRSQYNKKEVNLKLESSSSSLYIEADNVRITQALDNLLNNAVKFTQNGDTTIIKVERDENKFEVEITIKDTGIGISPELQPYLFDPFMQVDNSIERSNGGLGLGLAIVKGMVELHGGSVKVFSEGIGKGTKFTIRLPLINKIVEKRDNFLVKEKTSSKTLNVLMIDDNKDLTEIMCELINFLGHKAESALNGNDGILKAKELHPDVIICDIGLPVMNGYEVAKSIRKENDLKNIYLIALSGYAQQEDVERSRKAGFNMHLAKPLSMETLKSTLDEIFS